MKTVAQLKVSRAVICNIAFGCSLIIAAGFVSPAHQSPQEKRSSGSAMAIGREFPVGVRKRLWQQRIRATSPMSAAKVSLGQTLYFDRRLSADGTVSCATCHDPAAAFASKDTVAIGAGKQIGTRNAPTVLNALFSKSYFWDGRARTLEEQAKQPLLNPAEMGMRNEAALVQRISLICEYRRRFPQVFRREGITLDTIATAIATYERTLVSGNSPFDRFIAGDKNAITEGQEKGWNLFKGKARCIECHAFSASSPFFTDYKFYNTGIVARGQAFESLARNAQEISANGATGPDPGSLARKPEFSDLGRFLVTTQSSDVSAFKTPTLRDIELTGPYMHNGSLKTLLDVVRFYNQGGEKNPNLDEKMRPLGLTDAEMSSLVEFLRALTSDDVLRQAQSSKPQTRTPVPVHPCKSDLEMKWQRKAIVNLTRKW